MATNNKELSLNSSDDSLPSPASPLLSVSPSPASPLLSASPSPASPLPSASPLSSDTSDTSPLIICENLVKIYKVADLEVVALQGLDLVIHRGELMSIIGPSGSGKTSLMNILGGLDRPSAGRVWVDGYDLLKMSDVELDHYRRTKVGFVWQQKARNLIPYMDAQSNVELPLTLAGITGGKRRRRAEELLAMVGLADRRHHQLAQLSGGEQQRVSIAVALANDPVLLLGDEPTGEVDSATALTIYQTFKDLNRDLGLTILLVSHDPTIARHVQRVIAIRDGKMATETLRQSALTPATAGGDGQSDEEAAEAEHVFEELVVLDSAGRLQVPKEYLEHFNINRRVKLEMIPDGILIKPVADERRQTEAAIADLVPVDRVRGLRSLFNRLRRVKK